MKSTKLAKREKISIALDPQLIVLVDEVAERLERSRSYVIAKCIEQGLQSVDGRQVKSPAAVPAAVA